MGDGSFRVFGDSTSVQMPFDVAVVMPTILRPSIVRAVRSILHQDHPGRIQLVLGIDKALGEIEPLLALLRDVPARRLVAVFDPGYSTSVLHGGLHPAQDGGVLRCVLTFLANARHIAYLDDDNWWAPDHLARLHAAVQGKDWAFSLRWFTHPVTGRPVCEDRWESVGPDRGVFQPELGGFVDPNCLMIDKLACHQVPLLWNYPMRNNRRGLASDRYVFQALKSRPFGESGAHTSYYQIDPADSMHRHRVGWMGAAWAAEETRAAGRSPAARVSSAALNRRTGSGAA